MNASGDFIIACVCVETFAVWAVSIHALIKKATARSSKYGKTKEADVER